MPPAASRTSKSVRARPAAPARRARLYLGALAGRAAAALWRWFRGLSPRTRFRVALALFVLAVISPIWLLNLAVAFFGRTVVFPLSPYFLREKVTALLVYAAHRPTCAVLGHPEVEPIVARAEQRHRLPRGLLAAVVRTESAGKPHRISSAGAMGLGQLMPDTARMLGVSDPFDTEANIDGAARLLRSHLDRFGKLRLAIAAYNAGPGAVRGRIPQNGQTPGYVVKVMRTYAELRRVQRNTRPSRPLTPSVEPR